MQVQETKDYGKFKFLEGNREVDDKHVRLLQKLMLANGNLTPQFPVVTNKDWEIIDGQHRVRALQELGWPVYYIVENDMTLKDVRAINVGHKNWSWRDYAISYAELGNVNYQRILALSEEFPVPYHLLMLFCGSGDGGHGKDVGFRAGDFKLSDEHMKQTRVGLAMMQECEDAADIHNLRAFQRALYWVFKNPDYDHKRMVEKLEKYGKSHLNRARTVDDFLRSLEDTYNVYVSDDNKVRLF